MPRLTAATRGIACVGSPEPAAAVQALVLLFNRDAVATVGDSGKLTAGAAVELTSISRSAVSGLCPSRSDADACGSWI